ncbi:OCIA domain-containing protein 1-like [Limulus polyphemus]|uniref:OCIA domain-containing protein 1-like n=1 Tax=Limulus polyphemus TaxID=6850 RepID=A0ABM1B8K1_LIMPO|nr:OCIA domain-containing protein 1-like [Limulus polyphemus]
MADSQNAIRGNDGSTGIGDSVSRADYSSPNQYGQQPLPLQQKYRFTPEELRVLRECNRESFYYRCLPLAASAMLLVQYGVKKGFLQSSPKWGSTLKLIGAGFTGWVVGKISYQSHCEEKLMQLPNSQIGEMLRKKKGGVAEMFPQEPLLSGGNEFGPKSDQLTGVTDMSESSQVSSSLDFDADRNVQYKGLEETQRPSLDRTITPSEEEVSLSPKSFTSYDDLRRRNREEYDSRFQSRQLPYSTQSQGPYRYAYKQQDSTDKKSGYGEIPAHSLGDSENKYGDIWDK